MSRRSPTPARSHIRLQSPTHTRSLIPTQNHLSHLSLDRHRLRPRGHRRRRAHRAIGPSGEP